MARRGSARLGADLAARRCHLVGIDREVFTTARTQAMNGERGSIDRPRSRCALTTGLGDGERAVCPHDDGIAGRITRAAARPITDHWRLRRTATRDEGQREDGESGSKASRSQSLAPFRTSAPFPVLG